MAVIPFTLYLIACIVASNTTGQQCKPSEVSIPDKALIGHTYTSTVVSGPIQCQMLCENDPKCRSYNFHILTKNCEMNDETKETKPNDFVTDDQRFYMKREDIDECKRVPFICDVNANCQNTDGSYICTCKTGYTGNGKTCTGQPDPVAWFPLNTSYRTKEINNRVPQGNPLNVVLAPGPDGRANGSYEFLGESKSYIEFINSPGGSLNVNFSMTVLCWLNYKGQDGPVFNYARNNYTQYKWGVGLRVIKERITVHFRNRDYGRTRILQRSTPTPTDTWTFVGASYNHSSGEAKLLVDGKEVQSKNIGTGFELGTQDNARLGVRLGDGKFFKGNIAQLKVYNVALSPEQMEVSKNQL
ncbi:uncharacterized protein [Montipora foliosa]|uniref:uncharacterized protein n=1 Tax=Montipora foliosa TaxID=591990 RepID=UPI0035F1954F